MSIVLLSELIKRSSVFGVLKISFKASYNDSMGKDNTENKIFPLSQHKYFRKMSVCYQVNTTDSNTREKL